jgi:hypothetical protein
MGRRRSYLTVLTLLRPYPSLASSFSGQRNHDLDLDRTASRQRGDADGRTCVAPGIAEHVVKDPASPVHDGRLLVETRGRCHVPGQREDPVNPVERAQRNLEHRQGVQSTDSGCSSPFLHTDGLAKSAYTCEPAIDARELPGCSCGPVVDDDCIERVMRGVGAVENEPQLFEP